MTILYTRIPNELKRDLKILSFDQGVPLKEVVTEALSQYAVETLPGGCSTKDTEPGGSVNGLVETQIVSQRPPEFVDQL